MRISRRLTLTILLALLALLASCSSDDTQTPTDTDAPEIVQVGPGQDMTDVAVDQDVTISFNEDMDPDTAAGHVTLSPGAITALTWLDDRTLQVEHGDWPEGTHVTVTVGTGLKDVAGNGLSHAFAWSFWTHTDAVILQNTLPADGEQDVPINTQVWLEFSQAMDEATLPGAITVTSPDKIAHPYTLEGEYEQWTLTFDDDLPSVAAITVTVTTDAQAEGGQPLAAQTSFGFVTGDAPDTTPPTLLSIEPASGTTIPTGTSFIRLTFDEPVDDDSLNPSEISGQLFLSIQNSESQDVGVWSENHTVLTVPLMTPLIPGAILHVRFDAFADLHGNVNTTPVEWTVTVDGTFEYMPSLDTYLMIYDGFYEEEPARQTQEIYRAFLYETRPNDEFWRREGDFSDYLDGVPFTDYDRMRKTATAIQFLGFHEENSMDRQTTDVTFVPPVTWLKLPVTDQEWGPFTSTFSPAPPEGPAQVTYHGTIFSGTYELEGPPLGDKQSGGVLWLGCRKAVLDYTVSDGELVYSTGSDTLWFCPGVGPVLQASVEEQGETVEKTRLYLRWAGLENNFVPPSER